VPQVESVKDLGVIIDKNPFHVFRRYIRNMLTSFTELTLAFSTRLRQLSQLHLSSQPATTIHPEGLTQTLHLSLAASPLDPSTLIALRALVIIHMRQADTRATPCSQPMCAGGLRSSVIHGIGTVTDIPDQPRDLYIYR